MIGDAIRLFYCIQYPIQPRDAYTYGYVIEEWENTGRISSEIIFYPLSLWILKIPCHFFSFNGLQSGIIVNMILGLLIILATVELSSRLFGSCFAMLFSGLVAATHPSLVRFSCTCLRENTYLFFSILAILFLLNYYYHFSVFNLLFSSIFGALAFLCRLEGLELLAVVFIMLLFGLVLKKVKLKNALFHYFIFALFFTITTMSTCFFLNLKSITIDDIKERFIFESFRGSLFIFTGNPSIRQLPRAVESFSRNGSFTICSRISFFKYTRITDK